ncbi:MAG: transposase [Deltaproteobacteria bacterium]|nr:transposase [Deltaproteobacteria bacterium]
MNCVKIYSHGDAFRIMCVGKSMPRTYNIPMLCAPSSVILFVLFTKQVRGIEQELTKRRRKLRDLTAKLRRSQQPGARGKGYTEASLHKQVSAILSGQHMKQLLEVTITKKKGCLEMTYQTRGQIYQQLKKVVLGKRILFTDQETWSAEDIVDAYRGQSHVENAFRRMKNPFFVGWSPQCYSAHLNSPHFAQIKSPPH